MRECWNHRHAQSNCAGERQRTTAPVLTCQSISMTRRCWLCVGHWQPELRCRASVDAFNDLNIVIGWARDFLASPVGPESIAPAGRLVDTLRARKTLDPAFEDGFVIAIVNHAERSWDKERSVTDAKSALPVLARIREWIETRDAGHVSDAQRRVSSAVHGVRLFLVGRGELYEQC